MITYDYKDIFSRYLVNSLMNEVNANPCMMVNLFIINQRNDQRNFVSNFIHHPIKFKFCDCVGT